MGDAMVSVYVCGPWMLAHVSLLIAQPPVNSMLPARRGYDIGYALTFGP